MREVYAKNNLNGFQTPKVDSVCAPADGSGLFVGTADGALARYECQYSSPSEHGVSAVDCSFIDYMRRTPREKKPLSSLKFIAAWNAVLGISDSFMLVYDSDNFTALGQINESKGVLSYSVHERSSLLCTISKRKISLFLWQGFGFILRREIPLADTPRTCYCLDGVVVLGHKKWYEAVETSAYTTTRLLDVEKEHKMICMEIPAVSRRKASLLISTSAQSGTLLTIKNKSTGEIGFVHDESSKLEWAHPVNSVHVQMPFVVSFEAEGIEIHDVGSLVLLQRIPLIGAISVSISGFSAGRNKVKGAGLFVSTQDQLYHYSMIPIAAQIKKLMRNNAYEDALSLCSLSEKSLSQDTVQAKGGGTESVSLKQIHEQYAFDLHQKGDFEGAITQYIAAETPPASVIALFPELIPHSLIAALNSAPSATAAAASNPAALGFAGITAPPQPLQKLSGMILQRAASALLSFCEHYRTDVCKAAELALQQRSLAAQSNLTNLLQDNTADLRDMGAQDADERVRVAVLMDTVLLTANMICNPPRKQAVLDLVSKNNRCHLESCSVILASHGNAFFEALLGLYRSHGEHRKVFTVLSEDKCEGVGAWSRDEYYLWVTEYLRWLWYQPDPALAGLVLQHVESVIRYDAELGISVFMNPKIHREASSVEPVLGGVSVPFSEVLAFLRKIPASAIGTSQKTNSAGAKASGAKKNAPRVSVAALLMSSTPSWLPRTPMVPLTDGDSLGIVYLEWLTLNTPVEGDSVAFVHDEYAKLLMEKIPSIGSINHAVNDLAISPQDSEELKLYKILRSKLQALLQSSQQYRAERIIEYLQPHFLHEYALLLSRMKCHEEVLKVYVHFLHDLPLAEKYCKALYIEAKNQQALLWAAEGTASGAQSDSNRGHPQGTDSEIENIYLSLLKILLSPPPQSTDAEKGGDVVQLVSSSSVAAPRTIDADRLRVVMEAAERHCDKIDPCSFLELLPRNVPAASVVNFVTVSMEHATANQHNLQIIYQLLRMREVNIRTDPGS